ncbi:hypothetical protein, partial [Vibrio cholerae]|uniref:hypothetical protein n=1 Tax=Vibrio cholerae TaxID=666 RepID=UPI0011250B1E
MRRIIHKLPSTVRDKALIYLANGTDCTISDQIDSAKLKLDTFEFDKANALTFSVAGKAADMKLNAQGSASLMVNQA